MNTTDELILGLDRHEKRLKLLAEQTEQLIRLIDSYQVMLSHHTEPDADAQQVEEAGRAEQWKNKNA